ncbi:MAG: type II toxin-antitoxin system prevent-host-death family antitoxin [Treponema sp.]|jgi:prevent-host-death family protein|nr:type II toxin-antitoxin system prevent-host-death family antitoxin [Treponema sp.]
MTANVLKKTKGKSNWQLQEAKAMFSEVVKEAGLKPQIITVRGKEKAVIISFEEYKKLSSPKQTLFNFIQNSPLRDMELELPLRRAEKMREVSL